MNDQFYKDEPVFNLRPTHIRKQLLFLYGKQAKQLFIAVEMEVERLVKRYGIRDSKPDEKFIKTVQKAAAAKNMTVADYRDKVLFPHGKEKIIARFKQFLKIING